MFNSNSTNNHQETENKSLSSQSWGSVDGGPFFMQHQQYLEIQNNISETLTEVKLSGNTIKSTDV